MSEATSEYLNLMNKKSEIPGIAELTMVYGQYEELIRQTRQYFEMMEPKLVFTTTNTTKPG